MRATRLNAIALLVVLSLCPSASAELWPTLEYLVQISVAVVRARTVAVDEDRRYFQITEPWLGNRALIPTDCNGHYVTRQGEHGVDVVLGQEIILVFTTAQQRSKDDQVPHSTAFPIEDGKLVYGRTADWESTEYTDEAFKKKVLEIARSGEAH